MPYEVDSVMYNNAAPDVLKSLSVETVQNEKESPLGILIQVIELCISRLQFAEFVESNVIRSGAIAGDVGAIHIQKIGCD